MIDLPEFHHLRVLSLGSWLLLGCQKSDKSKDFTLVRHKMKISTMNIEVLNIEFNFKFLGLKGTVGRKVLVCMIYFERCHQNLWKCLASYKINTFDLCIYLNFNVVLVLCPGHLLLFGCLKSDESNGFHFGQTRNENVIDEYWQTKHTFLNQNLRSQGKKRMNCSYLYNYLWMQPLKHKQILASN